MKKVLFFAAALLAALSLNAESVYDWAGKIGSETIVSQSGEDGVAITTVKTEANTTEVACIKFGKSYKSSEQYNYLELTSAKEKFLKDDIIIIQFGYNNSASKKAIVGVFDKDDNELATSGEGKNMRNENGSSEFTFTLPDDMDNIRIARGTGGNTGTCVISLKVVRGETVIEKPIAPSFSKASGIYYEPFKVGLHSSRADKIYYAKDGGEYQEYTDSIEISTYDVEVKLSAYSVYNGENSEITEATYTLEHFVARPIFKARKTISLAGITKEDIDIRSGINATIGEYNMDGKTIPSVNYLKNLTAADGQDSVFVVGLKSDPDINFRYKNTQSDKANILKFAENYLQWDGSGVMMYLDNVQSGDTIVIVACKKGSSATRFDLSFSSVSNMTPYQPEDDDDPCFTDGDVYKESGASIENNYEGWANLVYVVNEGKTKVRIKETSGGARIAMVQIGAYRNEQTPVENIASDVKAQKIVKDGQVIILKGDKQFNVLGVEVK